MTLLQILIFIGGSLCFRLIPERLRRWALLMGSIVAIYWLQPARAPLRPLDFALPTLTLLLAFGGWLFTRKENKGFAPEDQITLCLSAALIGGIALLGEVVAVLPSPPPPLGDVILSLLVIGGIILLGAALLPNKNAAIWVILGLLVGLFVILKSEPLAVTLALWLRGVVGRPLTLAGVMDVGWLGFSYVLFRLIHTLRDRQAGKLPDLSLREYLTYVIFFPAYTAGPIDRVERFVKDLRALPSLDGPRLVEGSGRILIGVLKKFVIADSLALFALNSVLASQAQRPLDLWWMVYAFAFQLFFDFSGYSDIAIGVGRLYGINLPENFNRPYLKSNLTQFWQNWHATLSAWARFYVFMPFSRVLLTRKPKPPTNLVVLCAHLATMITIGLWHGINLNFLIWGVWHGIGLFIHKLYSDRTRLFYQNLGERPGLKRVVYVGGVLLTFHFVALGWVWFVLPNLSQGFQTMGRLWGIGW